MLMIVFHFTCVMAIPGKTFQTSYILAINEAVKQQNLPNSKIISINLTHWTTKTQQNVFKMSTVSRDTSRDGDATDWWLQQQWNGLAFCIRLTVSVLVLQNVIKIKPSQVRVLHRFRWKFNCSCVLSRLRNKSSIFYFFNVISPK